MADTDPYESMLAAQYGRLIENMLKPSPMMEAIRKDAAETWARRSRYYKFRHHLKRRVRAARQGLADWIDPTRGKCCD